jgi:hypothetical protein
VYLANLFVHIETGEATFEQIDSAILNNYGLMNKNQVQNLIEKFSQGFKTEQKSL